MVVPSAEKSLGGLLPDAVLLWWFREQLASAGCSGSALDFFGAVFVLVVTALLGNQECRKAVTPTAVPLFGDVHGWAAAPERVLHRSRSLSGTRRSALRSWHERLEHNGSEQSTGSQGSVRRSLWRRRPGGSFGSRAVRVSRRLVLRGWRGRQVVWSESSRSDGSPRESRAESSWQRGGDATDSWQGHTPEGEALRVGRHFGVVRSSGSQRREGQGVP